MNNSRKIMINVLGNIQWEIWTWYFKYMRPIYLWFSYSANSTKVNLSTSNIHTHLINNLGRYFRFPSPSTFYLWWKVIFHIFFRMGSNWKYVTSKEFLKSSNRLWWIPILRSHKNQFHLLQLTGRIKSFKISINMTFTISKRKKKSSLNQGLSVHPTLYWRK